MRGAIEAIIRKWNEEQISRTISFGLRVYAQCALVPIDIFASLMKVPVGPVKTAKVHNVLNPESGEQEVVICNKGSVPENIPHMLGEVYSDQQIKLTEKVLDAKEIVRVGQVDDFWTVTKKQFFADKGGLKVSSFVFMSNM